ncbi:unnamed protein product [Cuscuta campestris]|uniref:Retrotransposon gag domain-containing protein n=1 Tax=Cuscuta campestris TaxID=132261 RepID=A0A484LBM2_9ASTE|nr:unnamed protein product [Cuscuta campestris]
MRCAEDITIYSNLVQKNRLYQFLAGINDGLYKERRDLLNQDPLPTVEQAYTQIRREVIKRGIMGADSPLGNSPSEIGSSLATKGRPENPRARKDSKTNFICTHCGGTRHTKEGCFKIIGYPEWWPELKKRAKETPLTEKGKGGHKDGKANFSGSVAVPEGKDETGGMANIQGFSDGEDYWAWY